MLGFLGKKDKSSQAKSEVSLDVIDPRELDGHCLISGNLQIRGDVYFSGSLRIDGRVDGKVFIYDGGKGQLVVSKGAVINGPVNVTSALVDGTVSGTMDVAEKLECRPNAIIRGEVTYGTIDITDGARIEARCHQRAQKPHLTEVGSSSTPLLATRPVGEKSKKKARR